MKIQVVLLRSESSANVGAVARAMGNMGAERLILIDPRCALDSRARQMAMGTVELVKSATIYAHFEEFIGKEPDGVRIAFSRRGGRKRKVESANEVIDRLKDSELPEYLYLIFGPEAMGLNSEDLSWVNFTAHLPVFGSFASYNLSQAVLLALFLVRQKFPPANLSHQVTGKTPPPVAPFHFPDELLKRWLIAIGFDVSARRASAYLTLRRLFLLHRPNQHEIQVVESVLQQTIRKLSLGLAPEKLTDNLRDITRQ